MKLYKQRGDTIVEVLFAMAIIGLTLGIGYGIANRAIVAGRDAQEQTEASKFVEAQLERLISESSSDPDSYFNDTPGTQFCIDDTLIREEDTTLCRFGTENRYSVIAVRTNGGLFTVTGTWDNTRGNYQSTSSLVYRTYDFSVAVTPPAPVVPTTPTSTLGITSANVNPGIDTATFNANVSGNPVSGTFTFRRVSDGYERTISISPITTTNILQPLGAIAPGESYTSIFVITDAAGNTLSVVPPAFTTSTPTNMASANTPLALPGQSKYYLSNSLATCSQATSESALKGGHLVTIGSATENTLVAAFASPVYIWLGYSDRVTEGNWQWVTGEAKVFERWDDDPVTPLPEEPNDWFLGAPGEDCAVMNWNGFGLWNDWFDNATDRARYVIEYEIN